MGNLRIILFIGILVSCHGCMLARVLATEELLLVRGAAFRATATRVAIANEAVAMRNIARLRMKPGTLKRPILYLPEAGVNKPLFEIINQSTVRRISTGEVFSLPFRIFKTNGVVRAELRSGPGVTYKLYKTIPKDRFVLVRDEISGWYKIQFEEILGWVVATSVIPVAGDESTTTFKVVYTNIECDNCQGQGTERCQDCSLSGIEKCASCQGLGRHQCDLCKGKGQYICQLCKGKKNKQGCPSCKGFGLLGCKACKEVGYYDCRLCQSTGKIPCAICDGTLSTKCYYCFGTTIISQRTQLPYENR